MLHLNTLWSVIIAILWVGFFVLEGFDFGVGVLHTIIGRTDSERATVLSTIGPWWDGNEVWLIVAGAGMFAAFPGWYATMFSALYLALLLVLIALMARGVAFEFKAQKRGPALAHGVALGDDARLRADPPAARRRPRRSAERPADRLEPRVHRQLLRPAHAVRPVHGVTLLALCLLHGATFLKLRTTDHCASAPAPSRGRWAGWRSRWWSAG